MLKSEAIARLEQLSAAEEDPVLDAAALSSALSAAAAPDSAGNTRENTSTAGAWQAATAVTPGTIIVVSGRYWRAVVGGTTYSTAPGWPDLAGDAADRTRTIDDGGVVWADNGTMWAPTWNLNLAAMLAWERKAAIASSRYTFTTDGQQFQRAQVAASCLAMADRYRRRLSMSTRTD